MQAQGLADAGPFRFDGDRRGLLLVHGFTGTPYEMRLCGEAFAKKGYSVVGPRLAGHGAGAAALAATSWPDWYATVEKSFDELRARCDKVFVCGLSLGGLLTLELARRRKDQVSAIAVLAVPLWLPRIVRDGIRAVMRFSIGQRVVLPKFGGSDIADDEMRKRNPTGRGFPLRAVASLIDCSEHVQQGLSEVDRPAFVAHARRDRTAPFACMEALVRALRGPVEEMVLERSRHVITLDLERVPLFHRIDQFFTRYGG
jgi:carboxylesterase